MIRTYDVLEDGRGRSNYGATATLILSCMNSLGAHVTKILHTVKISQIQNTLCADK